MCVTVCVCCNPFDSHSQTMRRALQVPLGAIRACQLSTKARKGKLDPSEAALQALRRIRNCGIIAHIDAGEHTDCTTL
jgi:hypothetical protein